MRGFGRGSAEKDGSVDRGLVVDEGGNSYTPGELLEKFYMGIDFNKETESRKYQFIFLICIKLKEN
jgi:hypothetical protein